MTSFCLVLFCVSIVGNYFVVVGDVNFLIINEC